MEVIILLVGLFRMDGEGITCTETLLELTVSPSSASPVYIHVHYYIDILHGTGLETASFAYN